MKKGHQLPKKINGYVTAIGVVRPQLLSGDEQVVRFKR